jgi:KDO2-lipid IV(A) lauroyltransferase
VPTHAAPLRERAPAIALDLAARALERMPARLAYGLADAATPLLAAWGLAHELGAGRRGRGARRNLRIARRDALGARDAWRLLARHVRHLAHLSVDVCRIPRLDAARIAAHVDLAALDPLRELLAEGRGLVCVSGHLGVWELLGHAASVAGLPVTVVVRRSDRSPLDPVLGRIRASGGQRCVAQRAALQALRRALARGEIAGLLADEDERRSPLFAPFLGTLAATSPAAAFLQRVSGAPIAVVSCERLGRERHRIRLWRVIRPPPGASDEEALAEVTAEINAALGAAILARPEQWLWGSRRFATRPPGEAARPDGLPPRALPAPGPGPARIRDLRGKEPG